MKIRAVPLAKIIEADPRIIRLLLQEGETILCRNKKTGKTRTIPFRALYEHNKSFFSLSTSQWYYFIDREAADEILRILKEADETKQEKRIISPAGSGETGSPDNHDSEDEAPEAILEPLDDDPDSGEQNPAVLPPNFGSEYREIAGMSPEQRVNRIQEHKQLLDSLAARKDSQFEEVASALVDASRDATLINRATLQDAMKLGDEEAKKITQSLVNSTQEMVKSTTRLITDEIFNDELVKTIVQKSNGTVVQHMTRVYLNGVSFLNYYNNLVRSSGIANKLRIGFVGKYRSYYKKLLPHLHEEDVVLERVFYRGFQSVSEQQFHNFAVGFIVHDIGKAKRIEYHEGEAAYDRETVVDHVKIGYQAVMNKTNYPREAGMITGYHHEYYGNPDGYGYFRAFLAQYKKANPKASQDYCIAFEMEPLIDYKVLAFFPAKVLEIVDVFDSLTDPNRKYRKPLEIEDALDMMHEEFVEKKLKLDPILLDLFTDFIHAKTKT